MDSRNDKLKMLSELINASRLGDFTEYGSVTNQTDDPFLQIVISEFKETLETYHQSLGSLIDKLINHLGQ
ncbi:hypothetical protein [Streptococcus merionis]|uniref:hypothetical protein n=1 Tax=Streptococcus merionis TaxID=400065 RepID=UPI003518401B